MLRFRKKLYQINKLLEVSTLVQIKLNHVCTRQVLGYADQFLHNELLFLARTLHLAITFYYNYI